MVMLRDSAAAAMAVDDSRAQPAVVETDECAEEESQTVVDSEIDVRDDYTCKFSSVTKDEMGKTPAMKITDCSNILLCGMQFTNGYIGVDSRNAELIGIRKCAMTEVTHGFLQSAVDRRLGLAASNTVVTVGASRLSKWFHTQDYPLQWAVFGYISCVLYLAFSIILIILQTVTFNNSKTTGWLTVTGISLCVDIVVTRPIISLFKTCVKLLFSGFGAILGVLGSVESIRNDI